jgi:thiamine pyrophosphokinase
MKRLVIVGGAPIGDYQRIRSKIKEDDFFIYCDCGLKHQAQLQRKPDLIIGDFDSYKKPDTDIETIVLPVEKDDTDTFYAVKEGIKRGFKDILLLGVTGGRLDHTLGNLSALLYMYRNNVNGYIADDYSFMQAIGDKKVYLSGDIQYFSLLNIYGDVDGLSIKNAKYQLNNKSVTGGTSLCVSNELIEGKTAEIVVKNGNMLLVQIEVKGI